MISASTGTTPAVSHRYLSVDSSLGPSVDGSIHKQSGLTIGLAAWPDVLPFADRVWSPQSRYADVDIRRHKAFDYQPG
jgi:hypothetical protein